MTSRVLSEDPTAQGIRLNPCPACNATQQTLTKRNEQWKLACKCGKQSIGNSASQALNRWNNKKETF